MRTAICPTELHFHDLACHFLALAAGDRFLRFGWVLSDVDVVAYVEHLYQAPGTTFMVLEPAPEVAGAVHVELTETGAGLGLSVSAWARGKGIGSLLLERAGLYACSHGIGTLFVRNLSSNAALKKLAHRVGMRVACAHDAQSTRLEIPANGQAASLERSILARITLADDSLRHRWGGPPQADAHSMIRLNRRHPESGGHHVDHPPE